MHRARLADTLKSPRQSAWHSGGSSQAFRLACPCKEDYLASAGPGDVAREREAVGKVFEEINRAGTCDSA